MSDENDAIPVEAVSTGAAVKSAEVKFENYFINKVKTSDSHVDDIKKHVGSGGVRARASIFQKAEEAQVATTQGVSPRGPQRRQSAFAMKMSSAQLGDKCKRCCKTVYTAEKITAQGSSWHKTCFTCGLDSDRGCGNSLTPSTYQEYDGIIFCKNCSKKQYELFKIKNSQSSHLKSPSSGAIKRPSIGGGSSPRSSMGESSELGEKTSGASESAPMLDTNDVTAASQLFGAVNIGDEDLVENEKVQAVSSSTDAEELSPTVEETGNCEKEMETAPSEASRRDLDKKSFDNDDEEEDEEEGEDAFDSGSAAPTGAAAPSRRSSIDPAPGTKSFHECPFTFPFDKNGSIYWVGSMGNQLSYENPQKTGALYLEISTLYRGQLLSLTSYSTAETAADRIAAATYTNNTPKSWLVVDFGPERKLRPSYYCLKHGASGIGNAIRSWVLEGKVDEDSPWVELRKHSNDTTMREEPQSVAGYELPGEVCRSNFFRIFRISQTGKNSGGNDCLFIGGIDFYGIIKIEKVK